MATTCTVLQLEQARRRKGVSIAEIADSTKINPSFLRAIENEEFEKLPGGVYDSNYIRQYAKAIDYSEESLLQQYKQTGFIRDAEDSPAIKLAAPLRWISKLRA